MFVKNDIFAHFEIDSYEQEPEKIKKMLYSGAKIIKIKSKNDNINLEQLKNLGFYKITIAYGQPKNYLEIIF